jgi:transcriptional regulator with XRE-family HTH domain
MQVPKKNKGQASKLKMFRALFGINQVALAREAKISQPYLSQLENGRKPSLRVKHLLAALLEVAPDVLFPKEEK